MSYAKCWGPRSISQRPRTSKLSWSITKTPPGPLPSRVPHRGEVDAIRAAVDGVRPRVARALDDFLGADRPHDPGRTGIWLGIEDVDVRGAQPRGDQVAALDVRMRRVRAEGGAAGVPAEVVELVARGRHRRAADDLRVGSRSRVDVDDRQPVRPPALGVEVDDVGEALGRRLCGQSRRRVEARVGRPGCHLAVSLVSVGSVARSFESDAQALAVRAPRCSRGTRAARRAGRRRGLTGRPGSARGRRSGQARAAARRG